MLAALREPAARRRLQGRAEPLADGARGAVDAAETSSARPDCQAERLARAPTSTSADLPIQTCWPGEPAPLITWPLVITRPPDTDADDTAQMNIGVYRMQVLGQGPRHHALARASRRRGASSRLERARRGHAGRGGDRRRSGDHPGGRAAAAGDGVGISLLRRAARRAAADRARADRAADGSRRRRNRDRGLCLGDRDGARRALRRPHRLLQQRRAVSR